MSSFSTFWFIWQTPHTNVFCILDIKFSFDLKGVLEGFPTCLSRALWLVQVFIPPVGFWREDSHIFNPAWYIIVSGGHMQWNSLGMVMMDLPYTWVLLQLEKGWEAVPWGLSFSCSSTGGKAQQHRQCSVKIGVSSPMSCSAKIRGPRVSLKKQLHRNSGSKVSHSWVYSLAAISAPKTSVSNWV